MQQPPRPAVPPPRPVAPALPVRSYGTVRMLASGCIISAWLTLVLSVLFGLGMLVAPASPAMPGLPPGYSGGGDLGMGPSPTSQLGPLLTFLMPTLKVAGAVTTIGGGILSFFFLAGLGQGIYLLLDMEENTRLTAQALVQIARRQGS